MMNFEFIRIEIEQIPDPKAFSFEAYYFKPKLMCYTNAKKSVIISTTIHTRSLKSAVFRSITLANELTEYVDKKIKVVDQFSGESFTYSEELLKDSYGTYKIIFDLDGSDESFNNFILGKKKTLKKETNE